MTIPPPIHVGGKERTLEPAAQADNSESPIPSAPPEAASASGAEALSAPPADAAPTRRPPPLPMQPPPDGAASPPSAGAHTGEGRGSGFTSVIRHLSLREWLRWIQASRSDAVLRVRTPDGGSGTIWCNTGKVIDADWGELTPVAALREMLQLGSGAVTIDFEPGERPRRRAKPALDLVPISEGGPARFGDLIEAAASPIAAAPPPATEPSSRHSLASTSLPSDAPSRPSTWRWRPRAGRISRGEYLAAGLLLPALVFAAFNFGRLRASADSDSALTLEQPQQAQQIKSGLLPPPPARNAEPAAPSAPAPRDLSVIPFVAIEVEPANAEVWLDHALVGLGRVELAPIPDGALHELHFVAEGHAARSLFFVDSPPAGRVILQPSAGTPSAQRAGAGATSVALSDEPSEGALPADDGEDERAPAKRATRHRAVATAATAREAPPRQRPPADPVAAAAKPTEGKRLPQVQLIEARTPHVQVVE